MQEKHFRTQVRLPAPLANALKAYAEKEFMTVTQAIIQAVKAFLRPGTDLALKGSYVIDQKISDPEHKISDPDLAGSLDPATIAVMEGGLLGGKVATPKRSKRQKTPWPDTWTFGDAEAGTAAKHGCPSRRVAEAEFESFRSAALAQDYRYASWPAAWANWCISRRDEKYGHGWPADVRAQRRQGPNALELAVEKERAEKRQRAREERERNGRP